MGFIARGVDCRGEVHKIFLRGVSGIEAARQSAGQFMRNCQLVDVVEVAKDEPPADAKPLRPQLYEYGVMKKLNSLRRR